MLQKGKLDNIKHEMKRMKIIILGMSKVRWQGARKITSQTHECKLAELIGLLLSAFSKFFSL